MQISGAYRCSITDIVVRAGHGCGHGTIVCMLTYAIPASKEDRSSAGCAETLSPLIDKTAVTLRARPAGAASCGRAKNVAMR